MYITWYAWLFSPCSFPRYFRAAFNLSCSLLTTLYTSFQILWRCFHFGDSFKFEHTCSLAGHHSSCSFVALQPLEVFSTQIWLDKKPSDLPSIFLCILEILHRHPHRAEVGGPGAAEFAQNQAAQAPSACPQCFTQKLEWESSLLRIGRKNFKSHTLFLSSSNWVRKVGMSTLHWTC